METPSLNLEDYAIGISRNLDKASGDETKRTITVPALSPCAEHAFQDSLVVDLIQSLDIEATNAIEVAAVQVVEGPGDRILKLRDGVLMGPAKKTTWDKVRLE